MLKGLFRIIKKEKEQVIVHLSDETHPIFQAHFPDYPILPGFLLIEIIAYLRNDTIQKIEQAKFISHVFPNDRLIYNISYKNEMTKVQVIKDDKQKTKVAQLTYKVALT